MREYWFNLPMRTRLGVVSSLLLGVAVLSIVLWTRDPVHHKPLNSVIRFAPILFLLWLAWADLRSIPIWFWLAVPPVLIFCLIKPGAWLVVIPVTLCALFVMPKKMK